jgi:glycosyltransferase involved in cell wall biosynthesis
MILLISAVFPPEPIVSASITKDLANILSEFCEVIVLTPKPSRPFGFPFQEVSNNNIKYKHVILNSYSCPKHKLFGRMRESFSFGKNASYYIKKKYKEIDCIYFNVWPLFAQYFIIRSARKFSIPSIIHIQDIYPESFSNKILFFGNIIRIIFLPIDKYILKNASRIIAISENMRNTLIKTRGIFAYKIEIIQNWQDESEFTKFNELHEPLKSDESIDKLFIFMYLGNIGSVAGIEFIIESFAKANTKRALLVIAGSGSKKKECIQKAASYINANIEFWDVPSGKVPEIQNKADVMLLPLKRKAALSSIPSKLTAYMFSQKPVIACVEEESDTANVIKQANCGWIVPPENEVALTEAMQIAISLPVKELQSLGTSGCSFALKNFSRNRNLQKLKNIVIETATTKY